MKIILSTCAVLGLTAGFAYADLAPIQPISSVRDVTGDTIKICSGNKGGAYDAVGNMMVGSIQAATGKTVTAGPCGGSVGSLKALAAGEATVAIVQKDALAWLDFSRSPLASRLGGYVEVLTEDIVGICNRGSVKTDELNDVVQDDNVVAIAGGEVSGTALTFTVLSHFDPDFALPQWRYTEGWMQALQQVASGMASCAVGVNSLDSPQWRDLNDDFGQQVRLVGFWDGNVDDLEAGGSQVYHWRAIDEDQDTLDRLLAWKGKGDTWSPEIATVNALVVYRADALDDDTKQAIDDVARQVSRVKAVED